MGRRVMQEAVKNAAEAFRRSLPEFDAHPGIDTIAWPTGRGYVWIRATPDRQGHLSGKEEPQPKLYRFDYQRAKGETAEQVPPDSEFTGVMKAWTESFERRAPRTRSRVGEQGKATPPPA